MKNDYVRMLTSVTIVIIVLSLILKIDNCEMDYKTNTKKYSVCKKIILNEEKNSYCIRCLDANNNLITLYLEPTSKVTNIKIQSLYEFIEEGKQYNFTTMYYKHLYNIFPKIYLIGLSEVKTTKGD